MKLFNWLFSKNKKTTQPEFVFESWETKARHYDNVIKAQNAMTRYIQRG